LSSSAALEVSLLRGLRMLLNLPVDDIEIARLAQAAETGFVGAPVGIMDHVACSVGREGEALFIDTKTLAIERLPLPHSVEIAVIDSGIPHALAGGEYAVRRRESFDAATILGVKWLRDVDETARERIAQLPPLLARRARHVVTENERVLAAVAALRAGDASRLGTLLEASHRSMRDDYEVSTPDVDALVAIGQRHPDVYGARLTGGGFGGAVVLVAKAGTGRAAAEEITDTYRQQTGRPGAVLVPAA
jgi:galactokinase